MFACVCVCVMTPHTLPVCDKREKEGGNEEREGGRERGRKSEGEREEESGGEREKEMFIHCQLFLPAFPSTSL